MKFLFHVLIERKERLEKGRHETSKSLVKLIVTKQWGFSQFVQID